MCGVWGGSGAFLEGISNTSTVGSNLPLRLALFVYRSQVPAIADVILKARLSISRRKYPNLLYSLHSQVKSDDSQ